MARKILVLMDEITVRHEVIEYSLELAKRMGSSLILLLLLAYGSDDIFKIESGDSKDFNTAFKDKILDYMEEIHTEGIDVEAEVRIGDPSSELLKFLAETGTIETVVWGGQNSIGDKKEMQKKSHWLHKIRNSVECPIVFPVENDRTN